MMAMTYRETPCVKLHASLTSASASPGPERESGGGSAIVCAWTRVVITPPLIGNAGSCCGVNLQGVRGSVSARPRSHQEIRQALGSGEGSSEEVSVTIWRFSLGRRWRTCPSTELAILSRVRGGEPQARNSTITSSGPDNSRYLYCGGGHPTDVELPLAVDASRSPPRIPWDLPWVAPHSRPRSPTAPETRAALPQNSDLPQRHADAPSTIDCAQCMVLDHTPQRRAGGNSRPSPSRSGITRQDPMPRSRRGLSVGTGGFRAA